MASSTEFSASYDRTTKIVTAVVCVFLVAVAFFAHRTVAVLLPVVVIGLAYGFSPRGYAIVDRSIVVRRLIGNARFPLDGIKEARKATREDLSGAIRLWGSGGVFGYYGLFRTTKLGKSWWYVTNRANSVVVVTATGPIVLTPDDVEGFKAALVEALR